MQRTNSAKFSSSVFCRSSLDGEIEKKRNARARATEKVAGTAISRNGDVVGGKMVPAPPKESDRRRMQTVDRRLTSVWAERDWEKGEKRTLGQ